MYSLISIFVFQFLCVKTILSKDSVILFDIPQNLVNYTNSENVDDKQKIRKNKSNVVNYVNKALSKENQIFNWPVIKMRNIIKKSKQIQNEFEVKNKESECLKISAAKASVWDFGGTWSSDLAGVRFDMDVHSTVGMDKNMPVKILDRADCTKSNGFLNKGWMAKANAQYGRSGPVSLFAINRPEKTVAVFIGFVHTQGNKEFVTGMWSMGRNCKNNLDVHQSVFNIPDVLLKEGI